MLRTPMVSAALAIGLGLGCGDGGTVQWSLVLDPGVERAELVGIEGIIEEIGPGDERMEVHRTRFTPDMRGEDSPPLPRGRYMLVARGWDASCSVIAEGETEISLPTSRPATVTLSGAAGDEAACPEPLWPGNLVSTGGVDLPLLGPAGLARRPTFRFRAVAGAQRYRIALSCVPFGGDACTEGATHELTVEGGSSSIVSFRPEMSGELPVPETFRVLARRWQWRVTAVGPGWEAPSEGSRTFDMGWQPTDFTGDGKADVAVGAPAQPGGGAVFVYQGFFALMSDAAMALPHGCTDESSAFGASLAAGDLDGDGFGDLVVGAPGCDGTGRVFVYWGGETGIGGDMTPLDVGGLAAGSEYGAAVAVVGDVDGDLQRDVLVGAPGAAPGGAAFLHVGLSGTPTAMTVPRGSLPASATVGGSVSGGDLDGDGLADLILATASADVLIVRASAGGSLSPEVVTVGTGVAPPYLVESVHWAGDAESGGLGAFAAGMPDKLFMSGPFDLQMGGTVELWAGRSPARIAGGGLDDSVPGAGLGRAIAAGDTDGDTLWDLVSGAPDYSVAGRAEGGAVLVHAGGVGSDALSRADRLDVASAIGDQLGWAVALVDVDQDGRDEILAGAPGAGRVYLFQGEDGTLTRELTGGDLPAPGSRFGAALAGR